MGTDLHQVHMDRLHVQDVVSKVPETASEKPSLSKERAVSTPTEPQGGIREGERRRGNCHDWSFLSGVSSSGTFVGQTSQMQAFVDQVNATSSCATVGCTGLLKPTCFNLTGLEGAVNIDYDCTGCLECWLSFSSSALCETSGQNVVRLALLVAFIAAGCSYTQYEKVLAHTLVC